MKLVFRTGIAPKATPPLHGLGAVPDCDCLRDEHPDSFGVDAPMGIC